MEFDDALDIAERQLIDGATLQELKEAARDLRMLSRDSALADLVEQKIASIEARCANRGMTPASFRIARSFQDGSLETRG